LGKTLGERLVGKTSDEAMEIFDNESHWPEKPRFLSRGRSHLLSEMLHGLGFVSVYADEKRDGKKVRIWTKPELLTVKQLTWLVKYRSGTDQRRTDKTQRFAKILAEKIGQKVLPFPEKEKPNDRRNETETQG